MSGRGDVLVVGAGGGIGAAVALDLATTYAGPWSEGDTRLVCVDRDLDAAEATERRLLDAACRASAVAAEAGTAHFASTVADALADRPVSAVVYAVAFEEHAPADRLGAKSVRRSLETGPVAAYDLLRELKIRGLIGDGAAVVLVGSLHAHAAFANTLGYNLAQAATASLAQSLAHEWATDGIRVNEVVPGWTRTPGEEAFYSPAELDRRGAALPFGRLGSPADVVSAVAYLVSPQASYVSGARLRVDGALGASLAVLPTGQVQS